MSDKVFVIGSNSFTGASFVDFLLAQGCEVLGCSRSAEANAAFLPYKWHSPKGHFRFAQLDLNRDTGRIIDAINELQPSYVINFAAQSMVAESWLYPDQWYET